MEPLRQGSTVRRGPSAKKKKKPNQKNNKINPQAPSKLQKVGKAVRPLGSPQRLERLAVPPLTSPRQLFPTLVDPSPRTAWLRGSLPALWWPQGPGPTFERGFRKAKGQSSWALHPRETALLLGARTLVF